MRKCFENFLKSHDVNIFYFNFPLRESYQIIIVDDYMTSEGFSVSLKNSLLKTG